MNKKYLLIAGSGIIALAIIFFVVRVPEPVQQYSGPDPEAEAIAAAIQTDTQEQRYQHTRYGFSFAKPQGYAVGSFIEGDGEMLLVQSDDGSIKNDFQIFINPLTEPVELTPEFIKSDLPGTAVSSAKAIVLDGKAQGIMFASNNSAFGSSYEIWFVYAGRVYQVTSYGEFGAQLQAIIGTWKFSP